MLHAQRFFWLLIAVMHCSKHTVGSIELKTKKIRDENNCAVCNLAHSVVRCLSSALPAGLGRDRTLSLFPTVCAKRVSCATPALHVVGENKINNKFF